jgi:hypothetical protein
LLFYANLLNLNDKVAKPSSKPDENFVPVNFQSLCFVLNAWPILVKIMDKDKPIGILSAWCQSCCLRVEGKNAHFKI